MHSKEGSLLLRNGRERAEYGCITTWKNDAGKTLTLHRAGSPPKALGAARDAVRSLDPTFRLLSYSTPETVYRDLTRDRTNTDARTPEAILGFDLLHPDAITHVETFEREGGREKRR